MWTTEDHTVAAGHSVSPTSWQTGLEELLGRVAGRFGRVEPRRHAKAFVLGLLADLPRKNCWTIAEHAGQASPDSLQHLLAGAVWDHDKVRDDIRDYLLEHLADPAGVLVVDETGDLKKGSHTVGVQRQYTGTAGKVDTAQVAVYLAYATTAGHGVIDRELAKGLDDWWLELEALFGVAFTLACHRGELQAAAPIEQQFQAIIDEHPEPLAIGLGLATSQMLRLFAGDLDGSRSYGEQCLAGTRALGERWYESQILRTLALTSTLQGRHHQAEDELRECLEVALELGDLAGVALDLDRLGQAAVALGQPERAVVVAGAADRLRESVGGGLTVESGRWETEHPRDAARRQLTDTEIDRAWAQGRAMSLEDALAYARS
jgi:DDE superfamily endonuclease